MTVTLAEKIEAMGRSIAWMRRRLGVEKDAEFQDNDVVCLEAVLADLRERGSEDACPLCGWGFQPAGPIYRIGAEQMRERAAKVITDIKRGIGARDGSSIASALDLCERDIRALPVE